MPVPRYRDHEPVGILRLPASGLAPPRRAAVDPALGYGPWDEPEPEDAPPSSFSEACWYGLAPRIAVVLISLLLWWGLIRGVGALISLIR